MEINVRLLLYSVLWLVSLVTGPPVTCRRTGRILVQEQAAPRRLMRRDDAVPRVVLGHAASVTSLAWSPDGSILASGSEDETVVCWNARSRRPEATLLGHMGAVGLLAWSPDGRSLAAAG